MVGSRFLRSGGGDAGGGEGGESAAGGRGSIETLGIGSGGLSIAMMMVVIPTTTSKPRTNERLNEEE
jgi:hypothetical protein